MPLISRQVGATSQLLSIFVNDATVSTGAGLANIVASSVTFAWFRDNMSAVSSGTCTTGTLGTYGVSSFVQALSTNALGWYQFSPPNGVFLSGSSAAIHLSLAPSMAPLPILIELTKTDNQTYTSSQTIGIVLNPTSVSSLTAGVNVTSIQGSGVVTSAAGIQSINVTTIAGSAAITTAAGVLSTDMRTVLGTTPATSAAGVFDINILNVLNTKVTTTNAGLLDINLKNIVGTAAVTTSAGILAGVFDLARTANPNSTVTMSSFSISSMMVAGGVNVTSLMGSTPATNAAGVLTVDLKTIYGTAPVTTSAGILASVFDLARTANPNSTIAMSSFSISTQPVTVGGVNVTSIAGSAPVTSGAGILSITGTVNVTSMNMGVNVSSIVGTAAVTTSAGILASVLDLARTANPNSTVAFSSMSLSTQSVSVGSVNVSSIMGSPPITTSAGVLSVGWDLSNVLNPTSTVNLPGLSINAVTTAVNLPAAERNSIADAFLNRNVSSGVSSGRLVKEAFYAIRNKVDISAGIVYLTDDVTSSWAFAASTQAGNPLVSIDPT